MIGSMFQMNFSSTSELPSLKAVTTADEISIRETDVYPVESVSDSSTTEQESLQSQTQLITKACCADTAVAEKTFKTTFLALLYESDFDFGFRTPADEYIEEALEKYGTFAREWINTLFLDYFSNSRVTSAILRVIAHFDYKQLYPQGITMATAALNHSDLFVRECGIRCFENWESSENVVILKNITIPEEWLAEYLSDVIKDLEELED